MQLYSRLVETVGLKACVPCSRYLLHGLRKWIGQPVAAAFLGMIMEDRTKERRKRRRRISATTSARKIGTDRIPSKYLRLVGSFVVARSVTFSR